MSTETEHHYQHREAFCLMKYESVDRRVTELLWNSRDGVTPFCIAAKDGKTELRHTEWKSDRYAPDHRLMPGDRYFGALTIDKAKKYAAERIQSADGTEYEVRGVERERLHATLVESMMGDACPDVLTH